MKTRLPAATRQRQLLDVAIQVFAEAGFHTTSMNDIADAAGVTKPVLYRHFTSKRGLFRAALEDVGMRLRADVEQAIAAAAGPREQVTAGFHAYFSFLAADRASFRILFAQAGRIDEEFAAETARTETTMAELIAGLIEIEGLGRREREAVAYAIVGLAERAGHHWDSSDQPIEPKRLAELMANLAWAGLRGERPR